MKKYLAFLFLTGMTVHAQPATPKENADCVALVEQKIAQAILSYYRVKNRFGHCIAHLKEKRNAEMKAIDEKINKLREAIREKIKQIKEITQINTQLIKVPQDIKTEMNGTRYTPTALNNEDISLIKDISEDYFNLEEEIFQLKRKRKIIKKGEAITEQGKQLLGLEKKCYDLSADFYKLMMENQRFITLIQRESLRVHIFDQKWADIDAVRKEIDEKNFDGIAKRANTLYKELYTFFTDPGLQNPYNPFNSFFKSFLLKMMDVFIPNRNVPDIFPIFPEENEEEDEIPCITLVNHAENLSELEDALDQPHLYENIQNYHYFEQKYDFECRWKLKEALITLAGMSPADTLRDTLMTILANMPPGLLQNYMVNILANNSPYIGLDKLVSVIVYKVPTEELNMLLPNKLLNMPLNEALNTLIALTRKIPTYYFEELPNYTETIDRYSKDIKKIRNFLRKLVALGPLPPTEILEQFKYLDKCEFGIRTLDDYKKLLNSNKYGAIFDPSTRSFKMIDNVDSVLKEINEVRDILGSIVGMYRRIINAFLSQRSMGVIFSPSDEIEVESIFLFLDNNGLDKLDRENFQKIGKIEINQIEKIWAQELSALSLDEGKDEALTAFPANKPTNNEGISMDPTLEGYVVRQKMEDQERTP